MSTRSERFSYETTATCLPILDIDLDHIVCKTFGELTPQTLISPEAEDLVVYRPVNVIPIDQIEVAVSRVGDGKISWSLDISQDLSPSIRASTMRSLLQEKVFCCGIHDFTFGFLVNETDVRFSEVFGKDDESGSNQTPDFLKFIPELSGYSLVEFFTSHTHEPERMTLKALDKMMKYEHNFKTRCRKKFMPGCMAVIGVSHQGVVSNLDLSSETVDELTLRFRIFDMVIDKALEAQIIYGRNNAEASSKRVDNLLLAVEKIDLVKYNPFSLTTEDVERYKGVPDERKVRELLDRAKIIALEDKQPMPGRFYVAGDTRRDRKDVVLMPYFDAVEANAMKYPDPCLDNFQATGTGRLWKQGLIHVASEPGKFHPDIERLEKIAEILKVDDIPSSLKTDPSAKKTYHTFTCDLADDEVLEMAEQGIWGKTHYKDPFISELRLQKKKGFSLDTPVDDIERFLANYTILETEEQSCQFLSELEGLEEETRNIQTRSLLQSTEMALSFRKTSLWRATNIMSLAAQEMAISFKQNRKKDEFILKPLGDSPVWILLKPTKGGSHMFFSLGVLKKNLRLRIGGPFRKCIETENWVFSEISSVKRDRLENYFRCPMMVPSLVSFFCDTYNVGLEDFSKNSGNHPSVVANILSCLLMNLENKEVTEEIVTLTRFVYMEATRFNPYSEPIKPSKVISKFPKVIRSRFAIFFANKIIKACEIMEASPPVPRSTGTSEDPEEAALLERDSWKGLISFIDHSDLGSFRKALDLAYMGYFRSKDSGSDGNSSHKLIQKIVEEEVKLDKTQPGKYKGQVEPETGGTHTWSLTAVQSMAKSFRNHMLQTFGPTWETKMSGEIDSSLEYLSWNELATFKASAVIEPSMECPTYKKNPNEVHRKAINAILSESRRDHPIEQVAEALQYLSKVSKGISTDLFRKQQHGGTREIYVLTMQSRLVQIVIEKLARCLCNFVPFETMTHPSTKRKMVDEHHSQLYKVNKRDWVTVYNSDDAKRWSQNFMMDQFLALLINVLPVKYHKLVTLILNLWTNKSIKIPQALINTFCKNTSTRLHSPEINMVFDQMAHGGDLIQRGDNKMRVVSGFMQGILHYTSSFYHACCLMLTKSVILSTSASLGLQAVVTVMVSSDDSGTIVSLRGSEEVTTLHRAAQSLVKVKKSLSTLCGILTSSEKSTEASTTTFEFNSEFYNMHTHIKPRIKHVIAAHKVPTESSLINRQNGLSSLNSQLLEDGCPFNILAVVQYGQLEMHYRSIGLGVNPLFMQYWETLLTLPSPHLGLFLLDHPLMCGVAGSEYNHWELQHSNNKAAGYLLMMMEKYQDYGVKGTVDASFHVTQGNGKKFKKLKDEAKASLGSDEPEEFFEANPGLLYTDPESLFESKLKIYLKFLNPALRDSLDTSHSTSVSLASSVYFVSSHCIHPFMTDRMKEEKGDDLMGKLCLMALIHHLSNTVVTTRQLSVVEENFLFPLSQSYRQVKALMEKFEDDPALVQVVRRRRKVVKITLESMQTPSTISLSKLCGHKWFGANYQKSKQQTNYEWSFMKSMVPWLEDTHEASLSRSPFSNSIQMYNYINTLISKKRTLFISAPAVGFGKGVQMLPSVVKLNQHSYRSMRTDVRDTETMSKLDEFYVKCSGPPYETAERAKQSAINALKEIPPMSSSDIMDDHAVLVHSASRFFNEDLGSSELRAQLWKSKKCLIGYFTKRQAFDPKTKKYSGPGEWVGVLMDLPIRLYINGETCSEVATTDVRQLSYYIHELRTLLREFKLSVGRSRAGQFFYDGSAVTRSGPGTRITIEPRMKFEPTTDMIATVEVGTEEYLGGHRPSRLIFKIGSRGRTNNREKYIAKTVFLVKNPHTMVPCSGSSSISKLYRAPEQKLRTAWLEGVSLAQGFGLPFLNKLRLSNNHLTEWCKESFLRRAKALQLDMVKNELPSDLVAEVPEEYEPMMTIAELTSMSPEQLANLERAIAEEADGEDVNELVSQQMFQEVSGCMGFLASEMDDQPTMSIEYRHKLWDSTIQELRKFTHEITLIKQGKSLPDKSMQALLSWLLSVDESTLAMESQINWDVEF